MVKILLTVILISLTAVLSSCLDSHVLFNTGYNVSGKKVYYKTPFPGTTFEIPGADAATFKIIFRDNTETDKLFATDKNYVYYRGYMLAGSNGGTFSILDINFAKDSRQCYFQGMIIPGADPVSFIAKTSLFSMDKKNVYKGSSLMDHDASVFEAYDSSHIARSANMVSVFETMIPLKRGDLFRHFGYNYFAINGQVYFQDQQLPGAVAESFIPLDDFFSKTKQHVYYGTKVIAGADPTTFKLLQSPYANDGRHVFFFEKTITNADPGSFVILNDKFQCARDNRAVYHEDKKIQNATAADLVNKQPCRQCNEQAIYFEER